MKDDCTDIITRFIEILEQARPDISRETAASIETTLRTEYAGGSVYIARRKSSLRREIEERFTGHNTAHIAREMGVTRRTVYRIIKAARKKKRDSFGGFVTRKTVKNSLIAQDKNAHGFYPNTTRRN